MTPTAALKPLASTATLLPALDLPDDVADQVRAACASALAGNGPTVACAFEGKAQGQALLYGLQGAAYGLRLPVVFYPREGRPARGEVPAVPAAIMVRAVGAATP